MDYADAYWRGLFGKQLPAIRKEVDISRHSLVYARGKFDLLRIVSKNIAPGDRVIKLRGSIHGGQEPSGALTFAWHLRRIVRYAHRRGLKVIVYPLANPSGFASGTRYNIDGDTGEKEIGNNDHIRYELPDGSFTYEVAEDQIFKRWVWSDDRAVGERIPAETVLMNHLLRQDPLAQVVAAIDLHQDFLSKDVWPGAYHYAFGNLAVYGDLIEKIEKITPVLRNTLIDGGQASGMLSDGNGFIVRHDGSYSDLFWRLGATHSITVETTDIPLKKAIEVNLTWIFEVIDMLAKRYSTY